MKNISVESQWGTVQVGRCDFSVGQKNTDQKMIICINFEGTN